MPRFVGLYRYGTSAVYLLKGSTMTKTQSAVSAVKTPEQFGALYASHEIAQGNNDAELFASISALPYADYLAFRDGFKSGAIKAGYIETGFPMLWSRTMGRLASDFGFQIPEKPVTTKDSLRSIKSREKAKAETDMLAKLSIAELSAKRETLTPAIKSGDIKALREDLAIVKAINKVRKDQEKGAESEVKNLRAELREIIKTASVETLRAMLTASKPAQVTSTIQKTKKAA